MQRPAREIENVVQMLMRAAFPDAQQRTVRRYFTKDAGLRHPFFSIEPATNSRESILGVFQWYCVVSRYIELSVNNILYDEEKLILLLETSIVFHARYSPFPPGRTRLLTLFSLRKVGMRYYIAYEEDFFHPDDFFAMIVPPLFKPVNLTLRIGGFACGLSARIAQGLFGIWRPTSSDVTEG
ncbi:hypothetical protein BGY98DRAFT_986404 [Russula aff. rugulosa BPL654]|nr:hypothetical protein BGY98DRAFT_986404 [Russula aff. rugulosa BPL654]